MEGAEIAVTQTHYYVAPITEEGATFAPVEFTPREKIRKMTSHKFEGYFFPLSQILIEPGYNARMPSQRRDAHIRWIADQIRDHGFDQGKPLTGFVNRDGLFVVTDGHCRYEATLLANSEGAEVVSLPCLTEAKSFTDEDRALALFRRNEGKALEPLEVAIVIKRLQTFSWDTTKIAQRINKSVTYVENMLLLAGAPPQVREMVASGKIAASLAVETIKKEGAAGAIITLSAAIVDAGTHGKERATLKAVKRVSLAKGTSVDWKKEGPKLQKALQSIVDADSEEALYACVAQSRELLRKL